MYARSNTLRSAPENMDEGIAYVRDEVMPLVMGLEGNAGLSMLCDRQSGTCIVTTAWQSEEAMRASDTAVQGSRSRAAEIFGGGAPEVREWEVAMMHRTHEGHDGATARVIWSEGDPARAEETLSTFRMAMLPRVEELPGFCSLSMLVDRANGRSAMTVTYDSREDMERATDQGRAMREEFSGSQDTRVTDVAEFDVVLHHLRVPETV
jgi:heme-degrading monooxygenase HmoA